MEKTLMRYVILLLLSGCVSPKPYFEVAVGYQIDGETDYWVQTSRSWQCSEQPKLDAELGMESKGGVRIGIHHESWLLCGTGLNDKPEVYSNEIRITKKWGGYSQ